LVLSKSAFLKKLETRLPRLKKKNSKIGEFFDVADDRQPLSSVGLPQVPGNPNNDQLSAAEIAADCSRLKRTGVH
jgi:hypothetical protein